MSALAIIPARWESTRFPGKALCDIGGKPMIQWVWEQAMRAKKVSQVIIATDDERIKEAGKVFGAEVVMTRGDHASGTDRCAEVALLYSQPEIIINLQGDMPFLKPAIIDKLVGEMETRPELEMATCAVPSRDRNLILSPGTAKIVVDGNGNALYFSRSPLPCPKDGVGTISNQVETLPPYLIHLGIYAFRSKFLQTFTALPRGKYEKIEGLEQLRALENGHRIGVVLVDEQPLHVDTPQDAEKARAFLLGK
jgi:3-deoxy-manno-octulosonate cytidylyltransferase (CMP-KDO synthetase)